MRMLLRDLPVPLGQEEAPLPGLLAQALGGSPEDFLETRLVRLSLDARRKGNIHWLATVHFAATRDCRDAALPPGARLELADAPSAPPPVARVMRKPRIVVAGAGPAGSFCALRLLDHGIEPVLLERGPEMARRIAAVDTLWRSGVLDPSANAQFGEGGAGTFSDGKLATRIGHPAIQHVLETFVRFGADPRILHQAKPHVGTDVIRKCMVRLREEAASRGVQYRWNTRLADLELEGGRLRAVITDAGETIPCDALVLAVGHSARDTFRMLHDQGVAMRAKPFAMGVRIEHPQDCIDRAQYGSQAGHPSLPPADYRLACTFSPDRAAYSFCMCPGGEVILCSSERDGVVVNGMSNSRRNSGFANSGLVAKVGPADFGAADALAGVRYQAAWEHAAFLAAGQRLAAPAMSVQDFLKAKASGHLPATTFRPLAVPADVRCCLPEIVSQQLTDALPNFERKLKGFTSEQALLLAIESRTSSPVQILRGEDGQSLTHPGLYPCGEGAGYAGGITSAAVDGLRVAGWIAQAAGALLEAPLKPAEPEAWTGAVPPRLKE